MKIARFPDIVDKQNEKPVQERTVDVVRKKPIVHIITGLEDAGAEGALFRLCVNDPGTRHIVISLGGMGKYGPMLEGRGITVHAMNLTPARLARGLFRLRALLRSYDPSAVQTWMYEADVFGGIAARLAGITNVFWSIRFSQVDMKGVPAKMALAIRLSKPLSRLIPKAVVSCAHVAKDEHIRIGYTANPEKWHIIHNGYDFRDLVRNPDLGVGLREDLGIPLSLPLIGMVARYDPQKDHESLLQALGRIDRPFGLLLVGRGVDTDPELTALLEQHGLTRKTWRMGSTPRVRDVFNALDVHVLASRFGEGFPNVVAEAMACGATSISTDSGDARYILEDRGFLTPMRQPWALRRAIDAQLELNSHVVDVEAWREANRRHVVDRFDVQTMIAQFHAVWNA